MGAVLGAGLVAAAAGLTAVGANAVVNSTEGEAVAADERPVLALPGTHNAAVALVDDQNRLTSLVVVTLLPAGVGGSIVTIPVAADASAGLEDVPAPLDGLLDPADATAFFQQVGATLAVTLQFGEIAGANRFAELIEPVVPIDATLPIDVVDSGAIDGDPIVVAGDTSMDAPLVATALQAVDVDASEREQHGIDVAVWSALAAQALVTSGVDVPADAEGRPMIPATIDELFERMWSGPVQVRDISLEAESASGSGAVVLDRRDVVLVFGQVSPARVSTPNQGPVFRIEVPISDQQVGASESGFANQQAVGLNVVGQLLFLQANVASVDLTPNPEGAPAVTRIEVADEGSVATMEELGPLLFGAVEVVVADEVIDGIDVVVTLGTGYFDVQQAPPVEEPAASTTTDAATVDTDG